MLCKSPFSRGVFFFFFFGKERKQKGIEEGETPIIKGLEWWDGR